LPAAGIPPRGLLPLGFGKEPSFLGGSSDKFTAAKLKGNKRLAMNENERRRMALDNIEIVRFVLKNVLTSPF
jgi:hypothetical protein